MKVKETHVVELYALQTERSKRLKKAMDIIADAGTFENVDWKKVKAEDKEADLLDEKIESVKKEIEKEDGIVTSEFVAKMARTVYPMSISRCLQCLRICGVEVLA